MRWNRPKLTEDQIVEWAKTHFQRFGRYPSGVSGPVIDASGENWQNIEAALRKGLRGLSGGDTVSRFLRRTVGKKRRMYKHVLSVDQIVVWAREHHTRTGRWPAVTSGPVTGTKD